MDKIIYCSDLIALKAQLKADGYYDEESGSYLVNHTLTPLKYSGNTSLSYVRGFALDLSVYTMLEALGTYETIVQAGNEAKLAKYKRVYDYTKQVSYVDENGVTQSYDLPFEIGRFA